MESSITDPDSEFEAQFESGQQLKRSMPVPSPVPPKRLRRKASAQSTVSPSPGTPRQASPSRPVRRGKQAQGIRAVDIYEAIRSGKAATVTIVDEWIDSYKQDREAGLLVLINFIAQCCGCKAVVTREMFDTMQNAEIISRLTKEFKEESFNYPLSSPGPQWKRFRTGLCELMHVLVVSCQNSLLYDDYLFNSLLALLTGLSDSQVRAFRHTSTLLAMKLISAVVEVGVSVSARLQTWKRRYEAESSKTPQERATERLEELQAVIKELLEHREELTSLINGTVRGVFVHRYRDRVPDIRAVCLQELGLWLRSDPDNFLNDGYLKYLGWTLYDMHGAVRLQSVRALQALYKERDFLGHLEFFTSRFKERMLTMVFDKETDVAVEAVNLLLTFQQHSDEGLQEEECVHVYSLVFAAHRGLATAAGCFLYHKLNTETAVSSAGQSDVTGSRIAFFNLLITFFLQSECHDHTAYLVDSLWDVAGSELRDWQTVTTLLLQESGLSYEEEGALLEVMLCSIIRAAQATPPVGRVQGKRMLGMKDKKMQVQDKRRISSHFIPLLPQLLAKYSADVAKVSVLLQVPLYFDLETYSSARKLEKHSDDRVLEACARLAFDLCSEAYTFSTRANLAFGQLLDSLVECFTSYCPEVLQGTADEDDVYSASRALKRIAAFSSAKNLRSCELFEPCIQLLESGLMVPALKCASFQLLWDKVTMLNSTPTETEVLRLKKALRSFCNVSQRCLTSGQAEVRDQAFVLLCDLLLVYSAGSVRSQPALHALALPPSEPLRCEMAAFLMDYVFTDPLDIPPDRDDEEEEEKGMAALQHKRDLLAGYCKLVIYGVLDLSAATNVFKHYYTYYKDFGDIIKMTLSKSRQISPVQSAKTLFSELVSTGGTRQELGGIRDLAKKLAMSFGIDLLRLRMPLVSLHTDGIHFAFFGPVEASDKPPNLAFLEILSEFSFKLLRQDRTQLAAFLKVECPAAALSWPPVRMYQRSLDGGSLARTRGEVAGVNEEEAMTYRSRRRSSNTSITTTSVAKRRKVYQQDSLGSIHSNLHTPVLSSTMVMGLGGTCPSATPTMEEEEGGGGGISLTPLSEEEFSCGPRMRKVRNAVRRRASSGLPGPEQPEPEQDLEAHLTLLSLIEEDRVESEEAPEIEDFESSSEPDSSYTLPSTRHTSTSVLDDLFD
ncbi:hypothetical protein NHX12_010930 [Muraenolepis orangiensis]|uniref:Cohesin subunit SA n=1 Tax=Muraenolepis orangiensis TaxID=630683 RepID=A0A9Q0DFG1_9TELE|nr:hypothetical protein NHX12_010930 [Muraenolepis orangiensis]